VACLYTPKGLKQSAKPTFKVVGAGQNFSDFTLFMPPSAQERNLQASGQGQAIARLNGGLPCCSVPASTSRWAAKRRHAAAEETKKKEKR
jgi:hypothetical protein